MYVLFIKFYKIYVCMMIIMLLGLGGNIMFHNVNLPYKPDCFFMANFPKKH